MGWKLRCVLCELSLSSLLRMQEHVMAVHGYSHEDWQNAESEEIWSGYLRWRMPDGVYVLEAQRETPKEA